MVFVIVNIGILAKMTNHNAVDLVFHLIINPFSTLKMSWQDINEDRFAYRFTKTKNDMNKKNHTSGLMFGLTIFVGLMPLAFTFSQNGTQLLLETPFKYFVWCGQTVILLLLLFTKHNLDKNQLIGLGVLCFIAPFTFTFNENGAYFLVLNKYTSTILSWAIASVLFSKLFFTLKSQEKPNF
jgi:hypothetical protein